MDFRNLRQCRTVLTRVGTVKPEGCCWCQRFRLIRTKCSDTIHWILNLQHLFGIILWFPFICNNAYSGLNKLLCNVNHFDELPFECTYNVNLRQESTESCKAQMSCFFLMQRMNKLKNIYIFIQKNVCVLGDLTSTPTFLLSFSISSKLQGLPALHDHDVITDITYKVSSQFYVNMHNVV